MPRFVPKSEWSALPVQPPSGTWQLRGAQVYPALVVNVVIFFLFAFTTHRDSAAWTWLIFRILLATGGLLCIFFFVVAVRGAQLERRERKLGYSTWARKR